MSMSPIPQKRLPVLMEKGLMAGITMISLLALMQPLFSSSLSCFTSWEQM